MKPLICIFLSLFTTTIFAAESYKMDEKEMKIMMEQMQKMQNCMQKVDRNEITAAEKLATKIASEIKSMCANGKQAQAQEHAIKFSEKLATMPALRELRKCSEMAVGAAPMIPLLDQYKPENFKQFNVCDNK